jgi:hypothetical protein
VIYFIVLVTDGFFPRVVYLMRSGEEKKKKKREKRRTTIREKKEGRIELLPELVVSVV